MGTTTEITLHPRQNQMHAQMFSAPHTWMSLDALMPMVMDTLTMVTLSTMTPISGQITMEMGIHPMPTTLETPTHMVELITLMKTPHNGPIAMEMAMVTTTPMPRGTQSVLQNGPVNCLR